jgi:hypothetical protein
MRNYLLCRDIRGEVIGGWSAFRQPTGPPVVLKRLFLSPMTTNYSVEFSRVRQALLNVVGSVRCSYTSGALSSLTEAEPFLSCSGWSYVR